MPGSAWHCRVRTRRTGHVNLAAYGCYLTSSPKSAEDSFRDDLRISSRLLRSLGWQAYAMSTPPRPQHGSQNVTGRPRMAIALSSCPAAKRRGLTRGVSGRSPRSRYRNQCRRDQGVFQRLSKPESGPRGDALDRDWKLWKGLRELRQSKRGRNCRKGMTRCRPRLWRAADRLPRHPGPLAHANATCRHSCRRDRKCWSTTLRPKHEAGLVDYSDMIAMAGQLLRSRPDVAPDAGTACGLPGGRRVPGYQSAADSPCWRALKRLVSDNRRSAI